MNQDELFQQEEDCQKAIRTVTKALFMRVFVCAVLIWAVIAADMALWAAGLMLFVLAINVLGALPLLQEWKKQRQHLKDLIAQEE